jgi:putative phosphoesterase
MRIGVISDTHLTKVSEDFRKTFQKYLGTCDMILHAGDFVGVELLKFFTDFNFYGVAGNMDLPEVKNLLPQKQVIQAGKFRIGLIHGWGAPWGIEDKLFNEFNDVDCIVYGHTHQARNGKKGEILMFNPGTATDRRFTDDLTFGIITVEDQLSGEIIRIG